MDIQQFKAKYPATEIEQVDDIEYAEDAEGNELEVEITHYVLKNIQNLGSLIIRASQIDLDRLDSIISSKPELFKEVLGARVGKNAEIILARVQGPSFRFRFGQGFYRPGGEPIKISTQHRGKPVWAHVYIGGPVSTDMGFLASRMIDMPNISGQVLAIVSGLPEHGKLEADAKHVLRSILFDIELTYGIALESANIERFRMRATAQIRPHRPIPKEELQLVVKPYGSS